MSGRVATICINEDVCVCRPGESLRPAHNHGAPSPQDVIAITRQVAMDTAWIKSQTESITHNESFSSQSTSGGVVPAATLAKASAGWGRSHLCLSSRTVNLAELVELSGAEWI